MEVIKDVKQLKPLTDAGGVGSPPPIKPPAPPVPGDPWGEDPRDNIRRIGGRNSQFNTGIYHAGNGRVIGGYYDHTPKRTGIQGLARDFSTAFVDESAPKRKTKKISPSQSMKESQSKPLKEGPPRPPAKKKV